MYFIKLTSPVATGKIALIAKNLSPVLNVKSQEIERALAKVIGKIAKVNRLNKAERIADAFRNEGVKVTIIEYSKKSFQNTPRNFRIEHNQSQKDKVKFWRKMFIGRRFTKQLSLNIFRRRKVFTSYITNPSSYSHRANRSKTPMFPFAKMLNWWPVIIVSVCYISLLSIIFSEENNQVKERVVQKAQDQKILASIFTFKMPLLTTSVNSDLLTTQNKDPKYTLADGQVFANTKSDQLPTNLTKISCDQQDIYLSIQKGRLALREFAIARFKEFANANPKLPIVHGSIKIYIPPPLKFTSNSNATPRSCLKQAFNEVLLNSKPN